MKKNLPRLLALCLALAIPLGCVSAAEPELSTEGTTGGTLVLCGLDLTSQTTAPIACNKSTGVTLVAAAGTVNTLADTSANNDETTPENTDASTFAVRNDAGETLYEGTVPCEAGYLLYSAPELEAGELYTLLLNGEEAAEALSVTGESNGQPSGQTIHNANTATGAGIWLWVGLGVSAALSLPAVLLLRRRDRRENRG